jgi:hypothetical protein
MHGESDKNGQEWPHACIIMAELEFWAVEQNPDLSLKQMLNTHVLLTLTSAGAPS